MNLATELRDLLARLDAFGTAVDERLKIAERAQVARVGPVKDEQEIQKLGGLSRITWDAHRHFRQALAAADKLEAGK